MRRDSEYWTMGEFEAELDNGRGRGLYRGTHHYHFAELAVRDWDFMTWLHESKVEVYGLWEVGYAVH